MKKLNLSINTADIKLGEEDSKLKPAELCGSVLQNLMLAWGNSKKGFNEADRRIYYKITDALEVLYKTDKTEIELDDEWFGFIKKCKREVHLMPNKLVRAIEDQIDAVKER